MTWTAAQTLDFARLDLGITEDPPNSNIVHLHDGTDLWAWLHKTYGIGQEGWPWCNAWQTWLLTHAGIIPKMAPPEISVAKTHADYAKKGWLVHDLQPGDLLCFHFTHEDQHIEMAELNLGNGHAQTLGANTSEEGKTGSQSDGGGDFRRIRPINSIDAILRPPYAHAVITPGPMAHHDNGLSLAAPPPHTGRWQLHPDGGIFSIGDAPFYGSVPGLVQAGKAHHVPGEKFVGIVAGTGKALGGYRILTDKKERFFDFGPNIHP